MGAGVRRLGPTCVFDGEMRALGSGRDLGGDEEGAEAAAAVVDVVHV